MSSAGSKGRGGGGGGKDRKRRRISNEEGGVNSAACPEAIRDLLIHVSRRSEESVIAALTSVLGVISDDDGTIVAPRSADVKFLEECTAKLYATVRLKEGQRALKLLEEKDEALNVSICFKSTPIPVSIFIHNILPLFSFVRRLGLERVGRSWRKVIQSPRTWTFFNGGSLPKQQFGRKKDMMKYFKKPRFSAVSQVSMGETCRLGVGVLRTIFQSKPMLTALALNAGCTNNSDSVKAFVEYAPTAKLRQLVLSTDVFDNGRWSVEGASRRGRGLEIVKTLSSLKHLRVLSCGWYYSSSRRFGQPDLPGLVSKLLDTIASGQLPALSHLSLCQNDFTKAYRKERCEVTDEKLVAILKGCLNLTTISLSCLMQAVTVKTVLAMRESNVKSFSFTLYSDSGSTSAQRKKRLNRGYDVKFLKALCDSPNITSLELELEALTSDQKNMLQKHGGYYRHGDYYDQKGVKKGALRLARKGTRFDESLTVLRKMSGTGAMRDKSFKFVEL